MWRSPPASLLSHFTGPKNAATLAGILIEGKDHVRKLKCGGPAVKDYAADWPAGYVLAKNSALAGVIFDTEHLRCAAGWSGDFLQFKGVVFDGAHGPNPGPWGVQQIGTRAGPGWAKGSDLKDPRPIPYGPLPRDWARYKGLYRHDSGVVFSYTVGNCPVLEMPNVEVIARTRVFSRTLNLKASTEPLVMVVADLDGAKGQVENGLATLISPQRIILARVAGGPAGTTLAISEDHRLILKIPAAVQGTKLKVCLWGGLPKDQAEAAAALAKSDSPVDLAPLTRGSKARWPEVLTTQGKRSPDTAAYVLDDLTVPFNNPYKSAMRLGGFDFFSDGRAAVCTWNGDVWIVSGIDDKLEKLTWKRYAAGLVSGPWAEDRERQGVRPRPRSDYPTA